MSEWRCMDGKVATFLWHLGFELIRAERAGHPGHKATAFVFNDPLGECEKVRYDYFSGAGTTDAQRLLETYREIGSIIQAVRQNGNWHSKEL